jgi:hypothetical protein
VPGGPTLIDSGQRAAWSKQDRAAYYRRQAHRFQQMAGMEAQPRARGRLLELASQYLELAERAASQKTRLPESLSPATRGRND